MLKNQEKSNQLFLFLFIAFESFISLFRNIDLIIHARFWAEDGKVCFAEAYNYYQNWLEPFTHTYSGYLITYPRIIALITQFFPLDQACNIFILSFFIIKLMPPLIIISNRFNGIISSTTLKMLIITYYWFMPNSYEVFLNLTNVQWYLALVALLIIIANPSKAWQIFDLVILTLSGLTGPFSLFLIPIILLKYFKFDLINRKIKVEEKISLLYLSIAIICALLQLYCVSKYMPSAHLITVNKIFPVLTKALAGQIFIGSILGIKGVSLFYIEYSKHLFFPVIITIIGCSILIYTLIKGAWPLKYYILYTYLMLTGCFYRSFQTADIRGFESLAEPLNAIRYYFLPSIGYVISLGYFINKITYKKLNRIIFPLFLLAILLGMYKDFYNPKQTSLNYPELITIFLQVKDGTVCKIPINPDCWYMTLIKHP